ncbi:MAG: 50S ribosome-binding GTPase [Deltaproteobacteria bacterium]|nr:50S ribosome-binding GTPase [Deltaproteobacteria bacterium]
MQRTLGRWRVALLVTCFALPLLGFGIAGALWLYERGWLRWASAVFVVGQTLALFFVRRWVRGDQAVLPPPSGQPPPEASPREEAAWNLVQEYQARVDRNELVLSSSEQLLALGQEIVGRVAAFYRPDEKEPLLAVPIPLLLRAIEETARDLAQVTASLPFAHRITIGAMVRGYRFGQQLQPAYELYQLYRWLSPLLNPQSGLLRLLVTDRLFDFTKETLSQWLLKWYVDRVGYHAIALYSGKLLLTRRGDNLMPLQPATAAELARAETEAVEPLHMLVLGQVKAGKSSLVNALLGTMRAATDSVPTTTQVTPYVLEQVAGEGQIVLQDMGGYEDPSAPPERRAQALAAAMRADVVILVASAVNVAREPDRRLLQELRAHFAEHPELRPPPVLVALSHIDLLRPPLEWAPPYNVATPDSPKACSIRGALDAVAADLQISSEHIIPLCLLPERVYNVEDVLMPLLVQILPEAKRVLLLRSMKTLRKQEQWELLWQQARATGRFLWTIGGEVVRKAGERVRGSVQG